MADKHKFLNFISPILMLFQCFGIAPQIVQSKYRYLIHLAFQLIIIVILITFAYFNPGSFLNPQNFTNEIVCRAILLSYLISVCETIITKTRQLKIIDQLCLIDQLFGEKCFGNSGNYYDMKRKYAQKIWGVCFGTICFELLGNVVYYQHSQLSIVLIVYIFGHLGILLRLMQNAFYVDMVYERLSVIHNQLNKLKESGCDAIQHQLNLTKDLYGKLLVILQIIINLVNNANIMFSNRGESYSRKTTIGVFAFGIPILWPLILLAQSCDRCVMAAKKTSVILHNISSCQHLMKYAVDIRLLSLQIAHETFYISANGFCNIGYDTIGTIIQTSTLYLIIIIQFRLYP